jgi:hypothetical protein
MNIVLTAVGVAFAAFCVWLTVRIVNQRDRWRTRRVVTIVLIALPAMYVIGFGPAAWSQDVESVPLWIKNSFVLIYYPLVEHLINENDTAVARLLAKWADVGCGEYSRLMVTWGMGPSNYSVGRGPH